MKKYLALGQRIVDEGYYGFDDRTGKWTYSIFGVMERFDISHGKVPVVTTKKVNPYLPIIESLWMIDGNTNALDLSARGCKIWEQWGLPEDVMADRVLDLHERVAMYLETYPDKTISPDSSNVDLEILLNKGGIPKTVRCVKHRAGDCGPIYGEQMVAWPALDGTTVNQLQDVVDGLLRDPNSRHNLVLNFNPAVKPDVTVSPQENVLVGRQALAACHVLFQFYAKVIPLAELLEEAKLTHPDVAAEFINSTRYWGSDALSIMLNQTKWFEKQGVPVRKLSCLFYMRSNDVPVGLPFNLIGYTGISNMVAQQTNMLTDELIYASGNTHVYEDQLEDFKVQLTREPKIPPTLKLRKAASLFDYKIEDFTFSEYDTHAGIRYAVAL